MPETFGERLKELRKKSGLTQEQLADCTGYSLMTIRRWEWGERTPRLEEIKALAKALGVSEYYGQWRAVTSTVRRFLHQR